MHSKKRPLSPTSSAPQSPAKRRKLDDSDYNKDMKSNKNNKSNLIYNQNCNYMRIIFNAFGITLLGYIQSLEIYNLFKCGILDINQFSYKSRLNIYLNENERKHRFNIFTKKYEFLNKNFASYINESSYSLWNVTIDFSQNDNNCINDNDQKNVRKYIELFEYANKDSILNTNNLTHIHMKLILFYIVNYCNSNAFCNLLGDKRIIECSQNVEEFAYDEKGVNLFKCNVKFHEMMRLYIYEIFNGKKKDTTSWHSLDDYSFDRKAENERIKLEFLSYYHVFEEIKCCFKHKDKLEDCEIGNVYTRQIDAAYSVEIMKSEENITRTTSRTNIVDGLQRYLFIPQLIDFKKWILFDINIFRQSVSNIQSWGKFGYCLYFGLIDGHNTNTNDLQFVVRKVQYEDSGPSD